MNELTYLGGAQDAAFDFVGAARRGFLDRIRDARDARQGERSDRRAARRMDDVLEDAIRANPNMSAAQINALAAAYGQGPSNMTAPITPQLPGINQIGTPIAPYGTAALPANAKKSFAGFTTLASLAAGATATFQVTVQEPFWTNQLVISANSNDLSALQVDQVIFGVTPIRSNTGSLPATLFNPDSQSQDLFTGYYLAPNTQMSVIITNKSTVAVTGILPAFTGWGPPK